MLTSDSLTFEQCTFKAFETDAAYMTYNFNDGRCICKDSTAVLVTSTELSTAFTNECFSGLISTNLSELDNEHQTTVYPNPTNSNIILETKNSLFAEEDRVQLFSILGQQVYASSINSTHTKIDLSNYQMGTYILVARINGVSNTFKILKE